MNATPLLPHAQMQFMAMHFGWGLVLAAVLVCLLQRFGLRQRAVGAGAAVLALAWCFVLGPMSPTHWLGLAFQAPSLCTALLCAHLLRSALRSGPVPNETQATSFRYVLIFGLALGWLLLIDLMAWLPIQLYALGFHPLTSGLLLLLSLLPVVLQGAEAWRDPRMRVLPAAIVLFVLSRWFSGNVWDAVLDPWLWVLLNGMALRKVLFRGAGVTAKG